MARQFNTAVTCDPKRHYMVDTTNKMKVFERLINNGNYFTINRARQFGKSTSLNWIYNNLSDRYIVVRIDFANLNETDYKDVKTFDNAFCRLFNVNSSDIKISKRDDLRDFCKKSSKPVVLLVDNADRFINPRLLEFLCYLRAGYQAREMFMDNIFFHSAIIASQKNITNLPAEIEECKYNSPWNVAADYKLDMTFNPQEISTMLADYESENHIGFDINEISQEIYKYTSGYPVLVSGVCKEIDENLDRDWTKNGVQEAAKNIIAKKTNLSESMINNLAKYPKLKAFIRAVLMENFSIPLDVNNPTMDFANMFSIIKANKDGRVEIHNLIFQQILINHFISESNLNMLVPDSGMRPYLTKQGDLNMPLIINRFKDLMSKKTDKAEFLEREGRFMFICFLKPILNGSGFYYSEPENDDGSRMDLVITYNRKEYVIELKIWHGTEYELSGRDQLSEYLETRNLAEGYLVTFSFLKEKTAQAKPEWIDHNGKRIYEAVIDCGKE